MIKDILGILADVAGLVFIWWQPDGLTWYWKLTISIGLVLISFAIFYLTRDHREAKVKNYCWDENGAITLILNKNNFYSIDMLVSIYAKDEGRKVLCAIGYVKKDPNDKKMHVQVVHQTDKSKMEQIRRSATKYKSYSIAPSVTHSEVIKINWK